MRPSQRLYGNCRVLTGETLMFRCDEERKDWYLSNGLAEVVSTDPYMIRLTFKPKGPGHAGDPYFLQEFLNRCVACGSTEDLSHHHIVPYCYRKYFPKDSYENGRWFYDVLLLCVPCHDSYEGLAHELKLNIAAEHGVPVSGRTNLAWNHLLVIKAGSAIARHGHKLPSDRRKYFEDVLKTFLGKEVLDQDDAFHAWKATAKSIKAIPAGQIIVSQLLDLDSFAVRWRQHFVKHTKPRFLPAFWNPERRIYSEPK